MAEIIKRFPTTLELTIAALVISLSISIPIGILAATRRNSWIDVGAGVVSLFGLSLPNFWLGILLILVFSVWLRAVPSGGYAPFSASWDDFKYTVLPAFTLGASLAAAAMRMTRSSLLEVLRLDYVRTARAKGLSERAVISRDALRNSLIPVVTVLGIQAGGLWAEPSWLSRCFLGRVSAAW